jgi:hypothetical protein
MDLHAQTAEQAPLPVIQPRWAEHLDDRSQAGSRQSIENTDVVWSTDVPRPKSGEQQEFGFGMSTIQRSDTN